MIRKIFIIYFFLTLFFQKNLFANLDNKIVVKIDDQIITSFEIKNKILTNLILSDQEINQENINNLKKQTLESLIQSKLKLIELSKYNFEVSDLQLDQYLNSISSNDIGSLKKKFDDNGLDYELFLEELKTGFRWQQFIFSLYSKKINIDPVQVEKELQNLIKINENVKEYNLSEIEILIEENDNIEKKIIEIKQKINEKGFDHTAFNHSVSSTAANKGNIGWVNSKSLSRDIFEVLNKLKVNQVSDPIIKKNNVLFLKINKKRSKKLDETNVSKLKEEIINQKKNELFNLYSKSHISVIKNNSFIEYK